jgi:shikimate kinase
VLHKTIILIGMPAVGKTTLGWQLAQRLNVDFMDSDQEIEDATGCTIPEIFHYAGEGLFRLIEERIISQLFQMPPLIMAVGGGAFIQPTTRALLQENGTTIFLDVPQQQLHQRLQQNQGNRPLLKGDLGERLAMLWQQRYALYKTAQLHVSLENTTPTTALVKLEKAVYDAGLCL